MSYTRHIVHGAGVIFVTSALAGLLSYAFRILLARHLGPQDYGLFYAVFNVVIFFLFFRDWGLGQALIRYISSFKAENKFNEIKTSMVTVFLIQFSSSLVMAGVFFFLAPFLAATYFKDPRAELMLQLLTLYIVFSVLFITLKSTFLGLQKSFAFASFDFSKNLLVLLFVALLFYFGFTVLAPVIAYVLVCLALFLLYLPFLLRAFPFFAYRVGSIRTMAIQAAAFGLPVFFSSIGGRIIGYTDTLFLTYFRPLQEVGIYNAVLPSAMIFVDIGTSLGLVIFPLTAELVTKKDTSRLSIGFELVHRYFLAGILPLMVMLILFSEIFLNVFFGTAYAAGTAAFRILLLGVFALVIGSINGSIITGLGHPKEITKVYIVAALLNIVVNTLLIPPLGITGAAVATCASYLYIFIRSTFVASQRLQTKFPGRNWLKIGLASAGFTVIIYTLPKVLNFPWFVELPLSLLTALAVYSWLCCVLKIFQLPEIKKYAQLAFKHG